MKRQPRILAGGTLALLMASAPLAAFPFGNADRQLSAPAPALAPIRVQADCQDGDDCQAPAQQKPEREHKRHGKEGQEAAPAPEAPAGEAAPEQDRSEQPRQERRKKRSGEKGQDNAAPRQEIAPGEPAPGGQQAEPAPKPERKRKKHVDESGQGGNAPPAEEAAPAEPGGQQAEPAPKPERKRKKHADEAGQGGSAPVDEATPAEPGGQQAEPAPKPERKRKKHADEAGQGGSAAPAEEAAPAPQPAPGPAEPAARGEAPAGGQDAAPLLDSQKDAQRPAQGERDAKRRTRPQPQEEGPPPVDDRAAQQAIQPEAVVPITREKGKRRERVPDEDVARPRPPRGADIVKKLGDRLILEFGGQTMVESSDRPRMTRGARDVYYEDLPHGRTRETIERANGDRVVTIRNRDGDVVQRSRITPDGREHILSYVDERHYRDMREWRDPGEDLPPMRLDVPRRQYILESESVDDPDDYYEFLEKPPVERVQRLYSIDEVKRSARVRDIARRIDLDTLNFDFGSADIGQAEAEKLQGVAEAMRKLLDRNPAETFLIEGHTDAVGSDTANLALSDRRAEAVADALTDYFDIPPENLATQGYGERYLKVDTQAPERENRRVAIRRITPLVAPVAAAQ